MLSAQAATLHTPPPAPAPAPALAPPPAPAPAPALAPPTESLYIQQQNKCDQAKTCIEGYKTNI